MAVVSTTTVYRGLKAFSYAPSYPRSLILGLDRLARLPHEEYPQVRAAIDDSWKRADIDSLATALELPKDEYLGLRKAIIGAMAARRDLAKPHFDTIHGILRNANLDKEGRPCYKSGYGIRAAAAGAIIAIVGIENALGYFEDLDPVGELYVVRVLTSFAVDTQGSFETDSEHRERIRQFLVRSLNSSNECVRRAALISLTPAFGTEVVIIRSPEDYEWNPMFIGAFENAAANHPDPEFRQQMAETLQQFDLDRAVQKVLRKRQEASRHDSRTE